MRRALEGPRRRNPETNPHADEAGESNRRRAASPSQGGREEKSSGRAEVGPHPGGGLETGPGEDVLIEDARGRRRKERGEQKRGETEMMVVEEKGPCRPRSSERNRIIVKL